MRLQPELAEAALEAIEHIPPSPAPTGILTPEAVWQVVVGHKLGLKSARPDVQEFLEWLATDTASARWQTIDETLRGSLRAWLVLSLGDIATSLIQSLESGFGAETLALGLAMGALRQAPVDEQSRVALGIAQGRLERYTGNQPLSAPLIRQWNEASVGRHK